MKVLYAKKAARDLETAVTYLIKHGNAPAAARLIEDVLHLAERLAAGEFDGPEQRLRSGLFVRS